MSNSKEYLEQLEHISQAYEDMLFGMSDEEIENEIISEGDNPHLVADSVLHLMNTSIMKFKKGKLAKARALYDEKTKAPSKEISQLSLTRKQKEDLLLNIIMSNPQIGNALTIQYREFHKLSDSDLDDLLIELDFLKLLQGTDDDS